MTQNETTLTLPSDREILVTRQFNAPRQIVFEAWTKPEHVVHWWGAFGSKMTVCEIDLRIGGAYRYVLQEGDGQELGFGGTYYEIVPPERLVYSEGFDGYPGHEVMTTMTFEETDGKTLVITRTVCDTVEDCEGLINSGMEVGMRSTYDQFEAYIATLV